MSESEIGSAQKTKFARKIEDSIKNADSDAWMLRREPAIAASDLVDCSERAILENCWRATRAYRFGSLYEGFQLTNLSSWGADVSSFDGIFPGCDAPVIKNRCRSLVRAFIGKSFSNDSPLPQFTTKGGTFDQVAAAEDLDQAICAEFKEPQGAFASKAEMDRHGALIAACATGQYDVWCIDYDNSTRPELELDDTLTTGIYRTQQFGAIRHVVRSVWLQPEEAVRRFGTKFAKHIYENIEMREGKFISGQQLSRGSNPTASVQLMRREVRIIMGFAVKVGSEPGRQMFVLKDGTILRDKGYDKPQPPMVRWVYEPEVGNDGGTPLTQLIYVQSMYQNRILHDVDYAERNTPQVGIATQMGTQGQKAVSGQLASAKAVQFLEVDGPLEGAMKVFEFPKFSKDSLSLEAVYDQAQFDDTGIGRNHAAGVKQQGTTSGVHESLSASYYTETFADAERRSIEMRAVGCTRIMVWCLQSIAKRGFERWVGDANFRRKLRAEDLDLDDNKYVLEIQPVSEEKDTPKGRLKKAETWMRDPSVPFQGSDMVQMYRTYDDTRMAQQLYELDGWVEEQIERYRKTPIAEMGKRDFYQPPMRSMQMEGLSSALRLMNLAWLRAKQQKMPVQRLTWFEKFCDDCMALIQEEQKRLAALQQPPQQSMQPPPGMPG
jgi:hypothetical protein